MDDLSTLLHTVRPDLEVQWSRAVERRMFEWAIRMHALEELRAELNRRIDAEFRDYRPLGILVATSGRVIEPGSLAAHAGDQLARYVTQEEQNERAVAWWRVHGRSN